MELGFWCWLGVYEMQEIGVRGLWSPDIGRMAVWIGVFSH